MRAALLRFLMPLAKAGRATSSACQFNFHLASTVVSALSPTFSVWIFTPGSGLTTLQGSFVPTASSPALLGVSLTAFTEFCFA
jgi:hypothetical protein